MFTICLHTKFHMPISNGLLVISIKLKASENVCMVTLCHFTFYKNITSTEVMYFAVI
jgi:hypothetical protein